MVSTIKTDARRSFDVRRVAAASAGLVAGFVLIALSGPLATGAIAALPGDGAALALRHRAPVTDDDLLTVIESRSSALRHYGADEWRRELATASAMPRGGAPASREALVRAADQTRKVLAHTPASAQDWLRLGLLEARLGERKAAAAHLSTALLTGADMPRLRIGVIGLGYHLWPALSAEVKRQVMTAMRHEWRDGRQRKFLIQQARDVGYLPLLALVLHDEPEFRPLLARMSR